MMVKPPLWIHNSPGISRKKTLRIFFCDCRWTSDNYHDAERLSKEAKQACELTKNAPLIIWCVVIFPMSTTYPSLWTSQVPRDIHKSIIIIASNVDRLAWCSRA